MPEIHTPRKMLIIPVRDEYKELISKDLRTLILDETLPVNECTKELLMELWKQLGAV